MAMAKRVHRLCSIPMARWKNALNMYDRISPVVSYIGLDYEDCRPDQNLLTANDRVVGNISSGPVDSQVNQANAVFIVRDALEVLGVLIMLKQVITAIANMVLGVAITIFALLGADHFVVVRDVYGTNVVKYRGDYYKLVHVKINGTVEIVE